MNKKINSFILIVLLLSGLLREDILYSQTAGTFTLSLYTTSTGGYSPRHLVAIWIENSNANFVKTRLMQSSGSNLNHLALWTSRTGSNIVDAVTGATLLTHGNITVVWNGTDVTGAVVPDGTYNVWVEMAWANDLTTGKTYTTFPFLKGSAPYQSTPANLPNFYSISLNWSPGTPTLVETVKSTANAVVFPNPTEGITHIKFKENSKPQWLIIYNNAGVQVYKEDLKDYSGSEKTIDITLFPEGVYFVSLHFEQGDESYRIVKK